jgi:hypothetical protein
MVRLANMVNTADISKFDEVKRWIASIPKESTKRNYVYSLRAFVAFVGKNPKELIDETERDQKLDMRNRKDIVKSQCRAFISLWRAKHRGKHLDVGGVTSMLVEELNISKDEAHKCAVRLNQDGWLG